MNRELFRQYLRNIETQLFAFTDSRANDRISDNIRIALNVGTTLPTRFFLSLFALITGATIWTGGSSMFSHVGYQVFFRYVPASWWGIGFVFAGLLMLWRVLTPNGWPMMGWVSNILMSLLWSTTVASRVIAVGPSGLVSMTSVVWLMAAWCMIRTESTRRDRETA